MQWTDRQVGGWSLLIGAVVLVVIQALSPGRGMVDTVPSTSLTDLALAMGRNEVLAYMAPIVIICAGLLMLHGIVTFWRYAGPVPRMGLLGMAVGQVLMMVLRGFDYMIIGMGVAALEGDPAQAQEWLDSARAMLRTAWGLLFTCSVIGYVGLGVLALGLAFGEDPLRLPRPLHWIVLALSIATLTVFVAAWHSNALELALAPVFAAMSIAWLLYMCLLGWRLATSEESQ